jgi:TPR repeat protein
VKLFARTIVILLTIITMTFSAPAKADYQAGVEAYSKGDFKAALNEWLPLAEGGDATAQNAVGALYDRGLGMEEDDATAVHWYQLAADQSFPLAMRNLANMYAGGHGVPFDKDQAESWYRKAAEAGDPVAIKHMAALSPTGTEFAAAPAAEPTPTVAAPAAEPMTVAGSDQPGDAAPSSPAQTAEAPAPAPVPPAPTEAPAPSPVAAAPSTGGTDSSEAPQYGDSGSASDASGGNAPGGTATVAPTTTQQASLAAPPPMASDPNNWLIGMWEGPSLGCPPDGGLEFAPGETRSYYGGQIAARLPAKYQVSGDQVTVTSTGVDGVGKSYQYERRSPNTFVITAVPADMPQSMIGVEHRRCASAPFAAAVAAAPAAAPAPAPAAAPAAPTPTPTSQPAAKPFVPTAPAVKPAQPAAPQPQAVAAAQPTQPAAAPQPASTGSAQDGWDAFGRGDYKGALAIWQPLAEKGDVAMQLLVGSIYDYGQGVPQDDAEAVKWYERAANQGSAKGQYQAGGAYARSPQIKNPVEGYKWLTIAARTLKSGPQDGITADQAITLRTLLEGEMSKDDVAKAKQEADAFKAKKG